ncbi:MAG: amino acid adenylation domain-containing protein [Clostridia bacterium]|nr:amino acid adenylation domain-containing protein [Clostridia bacterium]
MNTKQYYPLTHPQKNIWYTEKVYPNTGVANIALTLKFEGQLDCLLLNKAVNEVVRLNEGMRLRVVEIDGEPMQYVAEYRQAGLETIEFSGFQAQENYKIWVDNQTRAPFEFIDSDLFYFAIVRFENNEGGLYIKLHHMITDAWGMGLIVNRINDLYVKLKSGADVLYTQNPSYIEYALKEQEYKKSHGLWKDEGFWSERFATVPEVAGLKTIGTNYGSIDANRKVFLLSDELTSEIKAFCKQTGVSVYGLFLSIMYVYIARMTSKEDMTIGTIIYNRSGVREKDTAGMFISTVPFRITGGSDWGFSSLLQAVAKDLRGVLKHQRYPYDLLLQKLREKNNKLDRLFDVIVSYQNIVFDVEEEWHFNGYEVTPLAMHISDRGDKGQLKLEVDYRAELFSDEEIGQILKHLLNLTRCSIKNPVKPISKLELLTEEERKQVLFEFNDTKVQYDSTKTIQKLFEEQVERTPHNTALVFHDTLMTYEQLNQRSNQLARALRKKGVRRDSITGIMVNRSTEMMIAIMGVLKAGGAYLPIDHEYPADRINYMLEDSEAGVLLTDRKFAGGVDFNGEFVYLDDEEIFTGDSSNLNIINDSGDLAYVIYTSGSTGKPKGVMLEHRAVVNFIKGITDRIEFLPHKTILALTTISFDIFVLETLLPLTKGLRIVIADESQYRDPELLNELIIKNNIDMLQTTPSRMQMLVNYPDSLGCFANLKDIMIGGEAFPQALLESIKKLCSARIYNMYGPTETTVWSTIKELTHADEVNIGKPIANTQIYILDKHNNLQPPGIPGELCIGGDGLARGYLNRPELTAEKFIPIPFTNEQLIIDNGELEGDNCKLSSVNCQLLYKTGDLARWLPDGSIQCLGRMDYQVKVRGFRIELGEIESQLLKHELVREAAVTARDDGSGNKYICAYFVGETSLAVDELREFLSLELPDYMIPSYFVQLERLPATPNGKIDRNALPEPVADVVTGIEYVPPRNDVEERLVEAWQEVLGRSRVGINESFFALGGDSIKAVQLISYLQRYNLKVRTRDIFRCATIAGLSGCVEVCGDVKESTKESGSCSVGMENTIGSGLKGLDSEDIDDIFSALEDCFGD